MEPLMEHHPPITPSAVPPQLAAALVAVQGELRNVPTDAVADVRSERGASYRYKYATLGAVLDLARPTLAKHGLAIVQSPFIADGRVGVRTLLIHSSGESFETSLAFAPGGNTPQAAGSAITYARRYTIAALLGIATEEDDDAAVASAAQTSGRKGKREGSAAEQDNRTGAGAPGSREKQPSRSDGRDRLITDAQRKRLFAVAMAAGTEQGFDRRDVEERLRAVLATYGYESSREIRSADYDAIVEAASRIFTEGPASAEPGPFD